MPTSPPQFVDPRQLQLNYVPSPSPEHPAGAYPDPETAHNHYEYTLPHQNYYHADHFNHQALFGHLQGQSSHTPNMVAAPIPEAAESPPVASSRYAPPKQRVAREPNSTADVEAREGLVERWNTLITHSVKDRQLEVQEVINRHQVALAGLPEYLNHDLRAFLLAKSDLEAKHAMAAFEKAAIFACAELEAKVNTQRAAPVATRADRPANQPAGNRNSAIYPLAEAKRFCVALCSVVTGKTRDVIFAEIERYKCHCCAQDFKDAAGLRKHVTQSRFPEGTATFAVPYEFRHQLGPVATTACLHTWADQNAQKGKVTSVQCAGCDRAIPKGRGGIHWTAHFADCANASGRCAISTVEHLARRTLEECTSCSHLPTGPQTITPKPCADCGGDKSAIGSARSTHLRSEYIYFGSLSSADILRARGFSYDTTQKQFRMQGTCLEQLASWIKSETRLVQPRPNQKRLTGKVMPISQKFIPLGHASESLINELCKEEHTADLLTILLSHGPRKNSDALDALKTWLNTHGKQPPPANFWQTPAGDEAEAEEQVAESSRMAGLS